MRTKYFLRGMGIGILVTVVIFAVAFVFYEPSLSEDELIAKAKEIGMIMPDEETDTTDSAANAEESSDSNTDTSEKSTTDNNTDNTEETDTAKDSEDTTSSDNQSTTESTDTEEDSSSATNLITFVISSGEGSSKIAENLYKAGLIDDPNSFNQYLEDNGYDNRLRTGSYNIPESSSYEEIANAITN